MVKQAQAKPEESQPPPLRPFWSGTVVWPGQRTCELVSCHTKRRPVATDAQPTGGRLWLAATTAPSTVARSSVSISYTVTS